MVLRRVTRLFLSIAVPAILLLFIMQLPGKAESAAAPGKLLRFSAAHSEQVMAPTGTVIDDALREAMHNSGSPNHLRFIVHMKQSAEPDDGSLPRTIPEHHREMVLRLRQTAENSQAGLSALIRSMSAAGIVRDYQRLWIINALFATGSAEAILRIAALPEVERVSLDSEFRYFDPVRAAIDLEQLKPLRAGEAQSQSWGIDRVRAPYVWHALGIDGSGVTVAIMDSGVDWQHPDLVGNYRGNLGGGAFDHENNWFDASTPTITEPIDHLGHGTHVAGTAVGQGGIGVAPGANWIAVAIADADGLIYESSVHSAFQWLLAPGGDPSLAPDIVNGSWGGEPESLFFFEDVRLLQAAGIITVFSAGNTGPWQSTINAPASYTGTIAIGASDQSDLVAWFSSRGPSPLVGELKPLLVAPGTNILSSLPGGQYGFSNGTSMAAPHVAGAIALLRSAEPSLSRLEIMNALGDSAVAISTTHPNDVGGWGRLDTYGMVAPYVPAGTISGKVRADGKMLAGVNITVTTPAGASLALETDGAGKYRAALMPGLYDLELESFGYVSAALSGLSVSAHQTTTNDFDLAPLASGWLSGSVAQAGTDIPIQAQLTIVGTPIVVDSDVDGRFEAALPENQYQVQIRAPGHRLADTSVTVAAGEAAVLDFRLSSAPTLLLVDSGRWYYDSYEAQYAAAFADSGYAHDVWPIRDPFSDVPTAADLQAYDMVVWSAPSDAPGYIGANDVITDYLGAGGNLLISGQDVGRIDGSGLFPTVWWYRDLQGSHMGETAVTHTLKGASGTVFEGLSLALNGGDGADNQSLPDLAEPRRGSLTSLGFRFDDDNGGGLIAGPCEPFRIVYLGFGLEGIAGASNRASIFDRAAKYFSSARTEIGAKWSPEITDDFALPGTTISYSLNLLNLSESITDSFHLSLSGSLWPTSLSTSTLKLGSCEEGTTFLTIEVPEDAGQDVENVVKITAESSTDPMFNAVVTLSHKTPGSILLVDDDRWYDQQQIYREALDATGIRYDVWDTSQNQSIRGSPAEAFLSAYDMLIWFTGYDWFAPVTPEENAALVGYLSQGGRLFLTSQDFLYYHHESGLARSYLGIIEYQESMTPTQLIAADSALFPSSLIGAHPLTYAPYQNFSDGLVPGPEGRPFVWHDQGMAAGVTNHGSGWRSLFWGLPFEKLPADVRSDAMTASVGWLSDLGDSTFEVDQRSGAAGVAREYSLALRNAADGVGNQVWLTNTLPIGLEIDPATVTGGGYDPSSRQLTWQGTINSGEVTTITYLATPDHSLLRGEHLDNQVTIWYERHGIAFDRSASVWIEAPDLTGSRLEADVSSNDRRQLVTYTLILENLGLSAAEMATATVHLPQSLNVLTNSLGSGGGTASLGNHNLVWRGALAAGEMLSVSVTLSRTVSLSPIWLPATAVIQDGLTDLLVRYVQPQAPPFRYYLPVGFRQ